MNKLILKVILGLFAVLSLNACDDCGGDLADAGLQGKCKKGGAALTDLTPYGGPGGEDEGLASDIRSLQDRRVRLPLDLEWAAVPGAATYSVIIAQDEGCNQPVYLQDGLTEPRTTIDADIPDGMYYLCVVAYDADGNVLEFISGIRFWIDNTPPPSLTQFYYEFSDTIGRVDLVLVLPDDISDFFGGIVIGRSAVDGVMPDCRNVFPDPIHAILNLVPSATHRIVDDTPEPGRLYHYVACAIDEAGNIGVTELANVRSTIMIHRVFVTSQTYHGNLGGIDGADQKCNDRFAAGHANLQNAYAGQNRISWKAMLATNGTRMADNISMRGPVYNADGTQVIARNPSQLFANKANSVLVATTENLTAASEVRVWTGSDSSGAPRATCQNWTQNAGFLGSTGTSNSTEWLGFSSGNGISCVDAAENRRALYCISQYNVIKLQDNFSVSPVASKDEFTVSLELAAGHPAGGRVELRRAAGAAVAASCTQTSDVVVQSWNINGSALNVTNYVDAVTPGRHAYRACVYDEYGVMVSSRADGSYMSAGSSNFREIFISSQAYHGGMGGLTGADGADGKCSVLAANAGLNLPADLQWQALLGATGRIPATFFNNTTSPLRNVMGEQIAASQSLVWTADFAMPAMFNEFGLSVPVQPLLPSGQVWTGFNSSGQLENDEFSAERRYCNNWNWDPDDAVMEYDQAVWGSIGGNQTTWASSPVSSDYQCSRQRRIYCVSMPSL